MSFVEIEFVVFLPLVLLLYWGLARTAALQNALLLAAGYLFYASWHWQLLGILIGGTLLDFVMARQIGASRDRVSRRIALAASLVYSLGALAFFKYEDFFATQANALLQSLGLVPAMPVLHLLLPLGISYYTLQRVGYMLDVYWERQRPETSLLRFALFGCFFPQLAAGPIARSSELLPQFETRRRLDAQTIANGCLAFLTGFAMQAWAGATIGKILVNPVFNDGVDFNALSHWLAVVGFALQVFADFAGYSLMAIGIAALFGIRLPMNFNYPFLSTSLPEFWRRWHITLNRWLFDYIFTPLTTSSGWFRGRIAVAMMLTFLASGLWHGAAWTFVLWGLLHGIGMIVHERWDDFYKRQCRRDRRFVAWRKGLPYRLAAWALTIGFFIVTLVPFRSADAVAAGQFLAAMMGQAGTERIPLGPPVLLAILFLVAQHLLQLPRLRKLPEFFLALPAPVRGVAYGLLVAFLFISMPLGSGTFIYQQF